MSLIMLSVPRKRSKEQESLGARWGYKRPSLVFYLCRCCKHFRKGLSAQNIFYGFLFFFVREELGHIKGKFLDQKYQPLSELHFPKAQRSRSRAGQGIKGWIIKLWIGSGFGGLLPR